MPLVELALVQQAQLFEELTNQSRFSVRDWHIVSSPGIRRDFVLAPTGITACLRGHFEQHEIAKAGFVEPPRRAQARHTAAHDDEGDLDLPRRLGERRAVAQAMAKLVR